MVTVIVPAHDEEAVIGRLLGRLVAPSGGGAPGAPLHVVVVCNGCSDRTAEVARAHPQVTVVETPRPSKHAAMRLGDEHAPDFPRIYVDADVEVDATCLDRLAAALDRPGVLAAAPRRVVPQNRTTWPVRWYYEVWEALPGVREGLFGRGVVALSREGHERLGAVPELMADDLSASAAFDRHERVVVPDALVVVHPPRTWSDLLRRRVRVVTGTRQAYEGAARASLRTDSRTGRGDLARALARRPGLWPKVPVFLLVTILARRGAARAVAAGDFGTWLRDESSRT